MGLYGWSSLLGITLAVAACSKKSGADGDASGSPAPTKTSAAVNVSTNSSASGQTTPPVDTSTPPAFDTANLPGGRGFNRADGPSGSPAGPENAMIRVLHTYYYRPVFLNLIDNAESFSIYQPMPITQIREEENNAHIDSYYIAGHAYSKKIGYPNQPTLMVAYGNDPEVLAPPRMYSRIWYQEASLKANKLFEECADVGGGHGHGGGYPNMSETVKCQGLGSTVTSYFGTTVFTYQQLFDILAVFFWKPKPYDGYQCLGHLAGNGKGDMPVTQQDISQQFSGLGTTLNPSIIVSAMYCIKQQYVVEGKIGDLLFQSKDKTLAVFQIKAKDALGFDDTNLFYAQACPSGNLADCPVTEKVYVLNRNYVYDIGIEGSGPK